MSEAAESLRLARSAGWRVTVGARSGHTEDDWLAELAVGWSGDQIEIGSITQSERLAKDIRLLAIESEAGWKVVRWPNDQEEYPVGQRCSDVREAAIRVNWLYSGACERRDPCHAGCARVALVNSNGSRCFWWMDAPARGWRSACSPLGV